MKRRKIRVLLWSMLGIFTLLNVIWICLTSDKASKASPYLPADYKAIFSPKAIAKFDYSASFDNKFRHSTASIQYDNKYYIGIFKTALYADTQVAAMLTLNNVNKKKNDVMQFMPSYEKTGSYNYCWYSYFDSFPSCKIAYLSIDAESSIEYIENDSLVCFAMLLNNFTFRYGPSSTIDFKIERKSSTKLNCNLVFYKKNKMVYFIMITGLRPDVVVEDNFIYKLLNG